MKKPRVGVLSLQGGIEEHESHLRQAGAEPIRIKKEGQLSQCQALILPGGESTSIGKTLLETSLKDEIVEAAEKGMAIWGTCAGLILLANNIENQTNTYLNLLDITVSRNGYGRQRDSFVEKVTLPQISQKPIPLVFIRAPYVKEVEGDTQVLFSLKDRIVAVQDKNILGTSFHPELTGDISFHKYFINMI